MNQFAKVLVISLALLSPVAAMGAEKGTAGKVVKIVNVYKDRAKLDNQKVTVKGKVVKVSAGIMGRNWLHIQDGSGSAANNNNDLTVTTTQDLPEVGKTVTVTGTVHKDKDFGAGYFYAVIVEDAVIK